MKRSKFSLSHYKLLSCDMGQLIPIGLVEVLPGDSIQQATSMLIRVSPLLAPVMHPVEVRIHHWFVPNRLVWGSWEDFITGGPDNDNASVPPYLTFDSEGPVEQGSLLDFYGVPPGGWYGGGTDDARLSAIPVRGYNLIFNEWYRDQDLVAERALSGADGEDNETDTTVANVAWEKDYFTSSRPWPQKGADVVIPFGATAPVESTGAQVQAVNSPSGNANLAWGQIGSEYALQGVDADGFAFRFGDETGLEVDLASATAVNVSDLRTAFALQRMQEARARFGSRYTEYLRYLGVRSSDARLQRPEYLGGGKQTIQFSEVLQTSPSETPEGYVGSLKGHGIGALRSNRYRRFFEEHGFIHSFVSVRPKTMYAQGLARHWSRITKEDYFQKELQHIGQQMVRNQEIYAPHPNPQDVFGYQDRYDEYRRMESGIAGDFRSSLDFWHYARIFEEAPLLNGAFVTSVPTKRVNAVQSEPVLWIMANHSIQARRIVDASARSYIL